jgi:hypothetical protein
MKRRILLCVVLASAACLAATGCAREERQSTEPAVALAGPTTAPASGGGLAYPAAAADASSVVAFPPRNEPYAFRQELEVRYRDGLHRSPSSTYVDIEGDIVWTQEYLRYRVNQCDHATAVQKVLDQIDGRGIAPVCGNPPAGAVAFPPRNESYAFRQELEVKYRDGLRRPVTSSYVDIEGSVVWTQEYLRYRVNRCGHAAATSKVMNQIEGLGIAPTCWDALSGFWDGTSTYFNAPFTMDLWMRDTSIAGTYADRHDNGYVSGTYSGGSRIGMIVNFGDGGIAVEGEFDGPDRIRGTFRVTYISGVFPFEMTRRPFP